MTFPNKHKKIRANISADPDYIKSLNIMDKQLKNMSKKMINLIK